MSTKNSILVVEPFTPGVSRSILWDISQISDCKTHDCVTSLKTVGETRGQVATTCLSPLFFLFMCARAVTAVQNVILLPLVSVSAAFFYVCTCCDSVPAIRALHVYRTWLYCRYVSLALQCPFVCDDIRDAATLTGYQIRETHFESLLSLNSTLPFIRSVKYHTIHLLACEKSVRLRTVPVPLEGPSFFLSSFVSSFARANCCSMVQCPRGHLSLAWLVRIGQNYNSCGLIGGVTWGGPIRRKKRTRKKAIKKPAPKSVCLLDVVLWSGFSKVFCLRGQDTKKLNRKGELSVLYLFISSQEVWNRST